MSLNDTPYPLRVGPYSVEGRVGQGGMATVLLGRTETHKRPVALKIIRAYGIENQQQMVRFKREIQALHKLSHPSLVSILDAGFDGEWFYYAMEYMEGGTLRNLLDVTPRLDHDRAFRLMLQLTRATAYLHRNKIIHRDIKPSNVLLANDGTAKLSDLGLLRFQEETDLTHSGQIIGTIRYMSPEMLDKYPMSYSSDIYQLGLLFFEMLAGRAVIEKGRPHQMVALILAQDPPRVSSHRADVDPALDELLLRCIQREPSERPSDGSELCAEIERIHENWRARPVLPENDDDSIHFIEEDELNFSVEMARPRPERADRTPPPPARTADDPGDDDPGDFSPSDADSLLNAMPSTEFEAIRPPPPEKVQVLPEDPEGSQPTDPLMPAMPRWKVEDTPRVVARERTSSDTIPVPPVPSAPAPQQQAPRRSTEIPAIRPDDSGSGRSAGNPASRAGEPGPRRLPDAPPSPSDGASRRSAETPGSPADAPARPSEEPGPRRSTETPGSRAEDPSRRSADVPTVPTENPSPPPAPPGPRRSTEIPELRPDDSGYRRFAETSAALEDVPVPPASEPSPRISGSRLTGVTPAEPPADSGTEENPGERPGHVIHFSPVPRNERQRAGPGSKELSVPPPSRRLEGAVIGLLILGVGLAGTMLLGDRNEPALPGSLLLSQESRDGSLSLRARWTLRESRRSKLRVRFLSREETLEIWKDSKDPTAVIALKHDPPYMVEIEKPDGRDHDVKVGAPPESVAAFVQVDCGSVPPPTWVHVSLAAPEPKDSPPPESATPPPTPTPAPVVTPVTPTPTPSPDPGGRTKTKGGDAPPAITWTDLPPVPPPEIDPADHPEGLEIVWKLPALGASEDILRPAAPIPPSERHLAVRNGSSIVIVDAATGAKVRRFDLPAGVVPGYLGLSFSDSLIVWLGDRIHVMEVAGAGRWSIPCDEPEKVDGDTLMDRFGRRLVRCERKAADRFRVVVDSLSTGSQSWSYTGEGQALGWVTRPGESDELWLIQAVPGSATRSPQVLAQKFHLDDGPGDGSFVTLTVLDGAARVSKPRMQASDLTLGLVLGRRFVVWKLADWSKAHDLELNARLSDPWPEVSGPVALARSSRPGEPLVITTITDPEPYGIEDGGIASATTGDHHLVLVQGSLFRYDITGNKIEARGDIHWKPRGRMDRFLILSGSDEPILDSSGGLIKLRWR